MLGQPVARLIQRSRQVATDALVHVARALAFARSVPCCSTGALLSMGINTSASKCTFAERVAEQRWRFRNSDPEVIFALAVLDCRLIERLHTPQGLEALKVFETAHCWHQRLIVSVAGNSQARSGPSKHDG